MNNIDYCKKCAKRKFDPNQGIVCSLTNEKPSFVDECSYFENDEAVKETQLLELRPNEQRASMLLIIMWIVLGLEALTLASSVLQYNLLQTAANGGEISFEAANANDTRERVVAILFLIGYILSGITFIMWFRRAYFNLHQKVKNLSYTEGWAAGCWFVPIVNLYRPYQIMKELYVETKQYLIKKEYQVELTTNLLGIWWTLWIVNGVIGQIVFRLSRKADTIPDLTTVTILSITSSIIGVVLGLVTIKIIKDYSKVEGLLIKKD